MHGSPPSQNLDGTVRVCFVQSLETMHAQVNEIGRVSGAGLIELGDNAFEDTHIVVM